MVRYYGVESWDAVNYHGNHYFVDPMPLLSHRPKPLCSQFMKGWAGSILYSTGIGLILKLFSSALQQKMIGENLSHFVKVRQFVGINSTLMKAMRLVLGQGGLSVPKVAILIGGPGKHAVYAITRRYDSVLLMGTLL